MTEAPLPPEPDVPPPAAARPHLPPWLAYGGVALCVLLLAAFLIVQFVIPGPSDTNPPPPKPDEIVYNPPPVVEDKPPVVEDKPPVVEDKPPVVEDKPPVVEDKPPVVEDNPPHQDVPPDVEAFARAMRLAQEEWDKSMYEAARTIVEEAVAKHSDPDGRGSKFLTQVKQRLDLVRQAFDEEMKKARVAVEAGQWYASLENAQTAARVYPEEGKRVVPAFAEEVRAKLRDEPMIPIVGRTVRLGEAGHPRFPVREATVADFSIEPTEVTIEKYATFCILTSRPTPSAWGPRMPSKSDHPVAWITLEDAEAYAAWIGRRLPTADEWELAARYVDERPFPWGPRWQLGADEPLRANTKEFGLKRGGFGTTAVGFFPGGASPHGVMDLAGNVWEWTATKVEENGVVFGVQKGGSFLTPETAAHAANGLLEDPFQPHADAGFRCAR